MSTPTTFDEAILQTALAAKKVRRADFETELHSLKDLIEAQQHVQAENAASKPHFGLRMTRLVPPGAG